MNKKQKNLWFDITTTMRWSSTPVGITKTETELANHFISNPNVSFCAYEKGRWKIVSKEEFLKKTTRTSLPTASNDQSNQPPPKNFKHLLRRSLTHTAKSIASKITSGFFFPLRPAIKQWLHSSKNLFKILCCCLKDGLSAKLFLLKKTRFSPPLNPCPFLPDDIYFSAGLNWDDKNFKILRNLKEEYGFKVVTVCYDLIPYLFPHFYTIDFTRSTLLPYFIDMVWVTDHFLCISQSTQRDLEIFALNECALESLSISVIKIGCRSERDTNLPQKSLPRPLRHPFCLAVSTIEPRKNYELLYRVWLNLIVDDPESTPLLVIVGKVGWRSEDLVYSLKSDPRVKDKILIMESVSDFELNELYASCLFTLYPSFYEGWGLPVAESLGKGKICVCSDGSSMREASQNLAIHLSPHDVIQWTQTVSRLISDTSYRNSLEEQIKGNYKLITWQDTASEIKAALNDRYSASF